MATERGTTGGKNIRDRADAATKAWVIEKYEDVTRYRKACKFIWDTALATLTAQKATTIIAGLPYGSGPALLQQIEHQQQRQTTMALFTLFSQLISLRLGSGETFSSLYARALGIRARLANWKPPIILPDQLIIVCLLRMLPSLFHGTRTIIMSTANVSLDTARDMLLDCENGDATRVAQQLGSRPPKTQPAENSGTGLIGDSDRRRKKKKKKRKPIEKGEKYHSEGPCSVHGSRCGHASSECYVLHPELKPKPKGEAAVADAKPEEDEETPLDSGVFGFMNESSGFALMQRGHEDYKAEEDKDAAIESEMSGAEAIPLAEAVPIPAGKKNKFYAVAVGHQVGIFLDWKTAKRVHDGYPGHKVKSFKTLPEAQKFVDANQVATAVYAKHDESSRKRTKRADATVDLVGNQSRVKNVTTDSAYESDSGANETVIKDAASVVGHMAEHVDLTCEALNKMTRKKPKNYHWSQKGTKASRRKARSFSGSNTIHPDVVLVNKNKNKPDRYNQGSIKQLARTGGLKTPKRQELVDLTLTGLAAKATVSLATAIGAARKDAANEADKEVEGSVCATVEDLAEHEVDDRLGVRSKYVNSAGTVTTMVYTNKVPRYVLSDPVQKANKDAKIVTLELRLNVAELLDLEPGSIVKLKVEAIVPPNADNGEALIAGEVNPKSGANGADMEDPYGFLAYDGYDDEDDLDEKFPWYKGSDSQR